MAITPHPLRVVALVSAMVVALAGVAMSRPAPAQAASTSAQRQELAEWWAPVHFQDTDTSGETALEGRSDYLSAYDFDGDLNGRNNWENTGRFDLAAHMYYSVVQTASFTYLIYMFFHPRDWSDGALDNYEEDLTEHENDSEGALVIVANDGSAHGTLKAAITVAHKNFYSYVPDGSDFTAGQESVDGVLPTMSDPHGDGHQRPFTAQQPNTHAAWAANDLTALRTEFLVGDGVLYYQGAGAEVPSSANDRDVQYTLTDIFAPGGMWDSRNTTSLFANPTHFAGDDSGNPYGAACGDGGVTGPAKGECDTDAASPPWGWDDEDDLAGAGYLATNPAELVAEYFNWPGEPSTPDLGYTWDPYNGITPPDPGAQIHNVLVVGDSISNGYEGDYTWRYRLWQWAQAQHWAVTFVGPLTGTVKQQDAHPPVPPPIGEATTTPAEPDPAQITGQYAKDADAAFSTGGSAHYAMWGRQLGQDVNTIAPVMNTLKARNQLPDMLLVELGFNDIGWLGAGAGLTTTMKAFIDNARRANPKVQIVLANVPHRTTLGDANPQLPQRITDYNAALARAVPGWSMNGSKVVLADFDGAYGCDSAATSCASTYDGLHPNALGEYRIARAFGAALHDGWGIGSAAPTVPTGVPARPIGTPTGLVFDGTQQGVTVTWPKIFGMHGYDVQWRNITNDANAAWQNAVPSVQFSRFDLPWAFTNEPNEGNKYQVRVRAVAGDADALKSPWSAAVTGVAHPTTAGPPATFHASAGVGSIHVDWTSPAGPYTGSIVRYALGVYDLDNPTAFARIIGYAASTRIADVTGVIPGHHYQVYMDTWNAAGEGKPTIWQSAVVPL